MHSPRLFVKLKYRRHNSVQYVLTSIPYLLIFNANNRKEKLNYVCHKTMSIKFQNFIKKINEFKVTIRPAPKSFYSQRQQDSRILTQLVAGYNANAYNPQNLTVTTFSISINRINIINVIKKWGVQFKKSSLKNRFMRNFS